MLSKIRRRQRHHTKPNHNMYTNTKHPSKKNKRRRNKKDAKNSVLDSLPSPECHELWDEHPTNIVSYSLGLDDKSYLCLISEVPSFKFAQALFCK
jgi:hypothetical protein